MEGNHDKNQSRILHQLLQGKRVSTYTILKTVGTSELRHYIARLRKEMNVQDEWVIKNGKRFKEYFLKVNK